MTNVDHRHETEKRRLRAAIARSRRRIDRRLRGANQAAGHLVSWQTYVRRWPGLALVAGLGLGWVLAAGLRPRFVVGLFGARLFREMSRQATNLFVRELKSFWSDTGPQGSGVETGGGDHA